MGKYPPEPFLWKTPYYLDLFNKFRQLVKLVLKLFLLLFFWGNIFRIFFKFCIGIFGDIHAFFRFYKFLRRFIFWRYILSTFFLAGILFCLTGFLLFLFALIFFKRINSKPKIFQPEVKLSADVPYTHTKLHIKCKRKKQYYRGDHYQSRQCFTTLSHIGNIPAVQNLHGFTFIVGNKYLVKTYLSVWIRQSRQIVQRGKLKAS